MTSSQRYTEDTLVQKTAADYLENQLGWDSVYAYNKEDFGPDSLLCRVSDRQVTPMKPLREYIRINSELFNATNKQVMPRDHLYSPMPPKVKYAGKLLPRHMNGEIAV